MSKRLAKRYKVRMLSNRPKVSKPAQSTRQPIVIPTFRVEFNSKKRR